MENHPYDPNSYHRRYPSDSHQYISSPAGSFSTYPPPPSVEPPYAERPRAIGPSHSFSGYPIDRPAHPGLYPSYSAHLQPSRPNPPYQPPYASSPQPPLQRPPHSSLLHSYSSIHYPPPPPAAADTAPPTCQPPHASPPHHLHTYPSDLRFPPPHSDSFLSAYPPVDHLLSDMKISDQGQRPPPPPPPVADNPSCPPAPVASFTSSPSNIFNSAEPPTPLAHSSSGQLIPYTTSSRILLLHGDLDVWVYYASNLPNLDMFSNTLSNLMGSKKVTSDPYVTISAGSAVLARTFVRDNDENPVWDQHFYVPVAHSVSAITFTVKDDDFVGSQVIGKVDIPVGNIVPGREVMGDYPVLSNGKPCRPGSLLKISIKYIPVEDLGLTYGRGIEPGPVYNGVPGTYFPLRKGGTVKLYQDAHVPDGSLPDIWMGDRIRYDHGKCWEDICKAIREARCLIYIAGWSVYHNVRLVRDASNGSDITLGELLRRKSSEAVRVLLLVWDDPTSRRILGYQKDGIMDTHDEETKKFFKHSSVQVLLCPRSAGKRHSWMKKQEAGLIYTHHQKSVIVDADAGNHRRKIVAFIGGLDLCKGRYDSPEHSLFRTLDTLHKDDFHNPNFTAVKDGGPREPWHDLHCKIDGPAAFDVLFNFQDRWLKVSKWRFKDSLKTFGGCDDDKLLKIENIPELVGLEESVHFNSYYPDTWHVQIFRSIDSDSVKGFPKDSREVLRKNLAYGKNVLIDFSIHTAYVKAIRSAQHFIYIENQYFLGSSYNWSRHKTLGANNLIPMEIALKIANKIKSRERFSAYIVIPMWPEGDPTQKSTQQILYWQNNTMQMMYETIYSALVEAGLENQYSPQDYLNFFCLGNREAHDGKSKYGNGSTSQALAQKYRRFMIYVHSKGMIVDDEYVIIGSANINQRSLEGTRDSEIAMGAYEPHHTWSRIPHGPRGQIYAYRMSLWAEHTGTIQDCFNQPESIECTRWIRERARRNWQQFASPHISDMSGHLLKYPVAVDRNGRISPLEGSEAFPDVGGKICGTYLGIEENLTI